MSGRHLTGHLAEAATSLAFKDDLTGLFNRRLLSHLFEHWWSELASEHQRMALLILDLDHFKEVNDSYGHLAGDVVLRRVAEILRQTFRGNDILIRFGGDEFVVLLPGAGREEAGVLAERARHALVTSSFTAPSAGTVIEVPVSFSLGVATFPDDGELGEVILGLADERLYLDKRVRQPEARGRSGTLRRAALLAGLGVAAVAAVVGLVMGLLPAPRPTVTVEGRAPLQSSSQWSRELALLVEIERLRFELDARVRRAEVRPQPEADRQDIEGLRTRLLQLEGQLDTGQGALALPTPDPAPPPAASPLPSGTSESASAAPTPSLTEPLTHPTPTFTTEVAPQLLRFERPSYPEVARRFGREAVVDLRVRVDATGKVVAVTAIGTPIGLGFDEAARLAAFRANYAPGTRNGDPVSMDTTLTVQFRLGDTR
ncbi:MAG: TonB family protein [Thermoanaerobaculaceae bacterium]|nr:TonB family protein [Thermoanaerobaculaceae bacterium]